MLWGSKWYCWWEAGKKSKSKLAACSDVKSGQSNAVGVKTTWIRRAVDARFPFYGSHTNILPFELIAAQSDPFFDTVSNLWWEATHWKLGRVAVAASLNVSANQIYCRWHHMTSRMAQQLEPHQSAAVARHLEMPCLVQPFRLFFSTQPILPWRTAAVWWTLRVGS